MTFAEVATQFHARGIDAAKRHGGVYLANQSRVPTSSSTIHENTTATVLREEALLRASAQSQAHLTPRSRSQSPSRASPPRRTPRTSCAEIVGSGCAELLGPWGSPRPLSGLREPVALAGPPAPEPVAAAAREPFGAAEPRALATPAPYGGRPAASSGGLGAMACPSPSSPLRRHGAPCSGWQAPGPEPYDPAPRQGRAAAGAGGVPLQATLRGLDALPSAGPALEPPRSPPWAASPPAAASPPPGLPAGQGPCADPRAAAFVRLNGFLLRTHITSLVSALSEDGWLQAGDRERLLRRVRSEDSGKDAQRRWSQEFMQIYQDFIETENVNDFVIRIQAQLI